jgi:hydrogenase nickel incorporation protein HypA/HybF
MHELPATQGMLDVALDAAAGVHATRVREIHLVVGDLTSMVDDSVQFYFDLLSKGTAAEGARLIFRREAAALQCGACGHRDNVRAPLPPACPRCGDLRLTVKGGQAFYVDSIDVDEPGGVTASPTGGVTASPTGGVP